MQALTLVTKSPAQVLAAMANPAIALLDPLNLKHRDEIVERSAAIEQVVSPFGQQSAVNILADLQAFEKDTEKWRKAVKDPFTKAGKFIEEKAVDCVSPVLFEITRLKKMLADFAREQDRIAAEAARAQAAELARLAAERKAQEEAAAEAQRVIARAAQEAERVRQEAALAAQREAARVEAERLAKEQEAKAAQAAIALAKTQEDLAIAQAELARVEEERARQAQAAEADRVQKAEETRLTLVAQQAAVTAAQEVVVLSEEKILASDMKAADAFMVPAVEVATAQGSSTRKVWKATVNDAHALYRIFPDLVDLKPKVREINAALKLMSEEDPNNDPKLPGCTVERDFNVSAKS